MLNIHSLNNHGTEETERTMQMNAFEPSVAQSENSGQPASLPPRVPSSATNIRSLLSEPSSDSSTTPNAMSAFHTAATSASYSQHHHHPAQDQTASLYGRPISRPLIGQRRPSEIGTAGSTLDPKTFMSLARDELKNSPRVMEEFLLTMKEFRLEELGMNGVISRITNIFKGRPKLLDAFNSFLPECCKIDVASVVAADEQPARQQPAGFEPTVPRPLLASNHHSSAWQPAGPAAAPTSAFPNVLYKGPPQQQQPQPQSAAMKPSMPSAGFSNQPQISNLLNAGIAGTARSMILPTSTVPRQAAQQAPPPQYAQQKSVISKIKKEELEPAVKFIQKIRNRFNRDQATFKTFLDIVDDFQSEQKSLPDLYRQISQLFSGHPDLIEDFRRFLPDQFGLRSPAFSSQSSFAFQRRLQQSAPQAAPAAPASSSRRASVPRSAQQPPEPQRSVKRSVPTARVLPNLEDYRQSADEISFFEKLRQTLPSQLYMEFLRVIGAFSDGAIGTSELLKAAFNFFGSKAPDLYAWFQQYVAKGATTRSTATNSQSSPESNEESDVDGPADVSRCKRYFSYRALPRCYRSPACSGKDEIAQEVLNFRYVSCPQFASEEDAFVASKKNQFEEALFKCEDDRFELDMLIDANQYTMALLQAVDQQISQLPTDEERRSFKLDSYLGLGTSAVIPRRALSKIYGDRVGEVMDGLMKSPLTAVPVVMQRLVARDEEWRRVQKESQRVWNEVHTRNYYRALDHASISFKHVDKRRITGRSLIAEAEAVGSDVTSTWSLTDVEILRDLHEMITLHLRHTLLIPSHEKKYLDEFFPSFFPAFFSYTLLPPSDERSIANCSNGSEASSSAAKASAVTVRCSGNIFFANNWLYALLKTFEITYSRLSQLKAAIFEEDRRTAPDDASSNGGGGGVNSICSNSTAVALSLQQEPEGKLAAGRNASFRSFMDLVRMLITGAIDHTLFEEKIRCLYGSKALSLCTVDKLIGSICKQAQLVLNDQCSDNLVRLYHTVIGNNTVSSSSKNRAFSEHSILMAARSIAGGNGESLFRLEQTGDGSTKVRLLETNMADAFPLPDSKKLNAEPSSAVPAISIACYAPNNEREERWSAYIDRYVGCDDSSLIRKSPPFLLQRNLRHLLGAKCVQPGAMLEPWNHVLVCYNLKCKICVNTYKMYFVENTEDFLVNRMRSVRKVSPRKTPLVLGM